MNKVNYFLFKTGMLTPVAFLFFLIVLNGCGVYSFTGASVDGSTINIHVLDNKARNIVPSLTGTMTQKIRTRILSQSGLDPVNTDDADYDLSGYISGYDITVTGATNTQQPAQNRLAISLFINFKNKNNSKNSFQQTFTRFADFPAGQPIQAVENTLINQISDQLADDVFNKAFVNW